MENKNIGIKKAILEKIKEYDTIVISRHIRPDGDAIGSTHGLATSLSLSFPNKKIIVSNSDFSEYLSFLNTQEVLPEEIDYSNALAIVLDTATLDRSSNKMIENAKFLIKIDHHIENSCYGDLSWVEDDRSSLCEMITDFIFTNNLKIDKRCAELLFTGMVTDSGRFKYAETTGTTLSLAGKLLDIGIDTQRLYANLYLEDFDYYKFQAYVFDQMKITENGVAYLYVDTKMQEEFNLSREQASSSVEFMKAIKGCMIWLAFIDNPDGSIRVRVRSRFLAINTLAEKYHGGGHANASGATVYNLDELKEFVNDADALLKAFKAENGDLL